MQLTPSDVLTQPLSGREAFEALYGVIRDKRKRWLALIARHEQDFHMCEELLSSATLKLMVRAQAGFEAGTNLEAYVHTTILNTVRSHASVEIKRRQEGLTYAHEIQGGEDDDSSDVMEKVADTRDFGKPEKQVRVKEAQTLLERALLRVAEKYPQAVATWRLFCQEELSCEEVSVRQGITAAAVSKQVFTVNRALKAQPLARNAWECFATQ